MGVRAPLAAAISQCAMPILLVLQGAVLAMAVSAHKRSVICILWVKMAVVSVMVVSVRRGSVISAARA